MSKYKMKADDYVDSYSYQSNGASIIIKGFKVGNRIPRCNVSYQDNKNPQTISDVYYFLEEGSAPFNIVSIKIRANKIHAKRSWTTAERKANNLTIEPGVHVINHDISFASRYPNAGMKVGNSPEIIK